MSSDGKTVNVDEPEKKRLKEMVAQSVEKNESEKKEEKDEGGKKGMI